MKVQRRWTILLILPFLILSLSRISRGEEPSGQFERMEREADLIFKGRVISTTESTNNTLFPYWANTHATRFNLISVLKGKIDTNEVVFWHVTHPPNTWGGGSPPADHQFEGGRFYIVFARMMDKPDYLYTPPPNAKDRPFEFRQIYRGGVTLTLDDRPNTTASVKETHWSELNLLLNDSSPSNQLYAIQQLDALSLTGRGDDWRRSKDFERNVVLQAIRPLIHNSNDTIAITALGCFRLGSTRSNIAESHIPELIKVADGAPSITRRLAAIGAFAEMPDPAVSNSLPRWLRDTNRDVRAAAIMLLTHYAGDFQEQALKVGAKDPSAKVRTAVVNAIGEARVAALIPTLTQLFTVSASSNTPVKPLTKEELESGSYYAGGGYIVGDPNYPNVSFGYPPENLGDVHTSAGFALLRFDVAQVADILKTNQYDPGFRLNFLCKLSEQDAGPWLEEMAKIMDQRLEREKKKSAGWGADPKKYRPELTGLHLRCWRIICDYLKGLPYADFADGKMDRFFNTLEQSTGSGSQERIMLYELYKMKGLNKRAAAFRNEVAKQDSWKVQFLDKIDAKYPKNGAIPDQ